MRVFLTLSVLAWGGYGIYCFAAPEALAGIAGVTSLSTTGAVELRAMYGGLQTALGVLAAAALWRVDLQRAAVLALAFACGGLFVARLAGALLAGEFSAYTGPALLFEGAYTAVATVLLLRTATPSAAR